MSLIPPHRAFTAFPGSIHLREALRATRHVAVKGRNNVAEVAGRAGSPVADVAQFALSRADRLAGLVEDVAGRVFVDPSRTELAATGLGESRQAADLFAAGAYRALRDIMRHLGVGHALISELRLRHAFLAAREASDLPRAARLFLEMRRLGVISDAEAQETAKTPEKHVADRALFALVLLMLSGRDIGAADEAGRSAVMLATALCRDILCAGDDAEAIAALLEEFRHHV